MRPMFLAVQEATRELGGAEKLAARLGVTPGQVYKYGQDPVESGKDIPVRHLITLIALTASDTTRPLLQKICNELIAHFTVPGRRRVVSDQAIEDLEHALKVLKNGGNGLVGANNHSPVTACPECRGALRLIAKVNGVSIFECPSCHGLGADAPIEAGRNR